LRPSSDFHADRFEKRFCGDALKFSTLFEVAEYDDFIAVEIGECGGWTEFFSTGHGMGGDDIFSNLRRNVFYDFRFCAAEVDNGTAGRDVGEFLKRFDNAFNRDREKNNIGFFISFSSFP
jgi:hypothetical protein